MKCFYHSADLDGHCSGAIIKMAFPECDMIGINYGDEFPWDDIGPDELIFMVDFSIQPFEGMLRLNQSCGTLIWIDHHISAIKESEVYGNKFYGLQRDGIGACALTWEYTWEYLKSLGHFYTEDFQNISSESDLPTFIKLLAEYDVWNHSDPRTLSFQYGMRQQPNTWPDNQDFWNSLFDVEEVQRITEIGGTILKYQLAENEKYCSACAFETELDGLKCIAINKMLTNSQLFNSVWDSQKYDAMLTFGWRKGKWTVSLYSDRDDIDVSSVAKKHGGGGHKGAAGFQCEYLPFNLT